MRWLIVLWLGIVGSLLGPTIGVRAQKIGDREAEVLLRSAKADEVRQGIEALGLSASRQAVELLSARIREGLPAELLKEAVSTLGALGDAKAGGLLIELARHRRPEVRVVAIAALVSCKVPKAAEVLVERLGDFDPRVRSAAATGLGEIGERSHLSSLFRALDRGVFEAAGAIGQLGSHKDIERLMGYLQRVPFASFKLALMEVLVRKDLPVSLKILVVQRLGELGSAEMARFLREEALPSVPSDKAHEPVRTLVDSVVVRMGQ